VSPGATSRHLLRRTVAKAWQDRVLGLSAETAFWQLLSLPPLTLAGIAALGYVSHWFGSGTVASIDTQLEATFSSAFSQQMVDQTVAPILREVLYGQRIDIISIGFILALWAGSSATATFVNTITIAYGMRDQRGAVRSRLLALWLFLGSIAIGVVLLPLLVLGPGMVAHLFPESVRPTARDFINHGYYPAVVILVVVWLASFYHLAPPRRLPWRRGLPGALFALVVFLAGSAGLRAYIDFILDHNHAYSTLAAPIAALLFFYFLALGVLLGAEFNAAIEARWPSPARPPRVLNPRGWRALDDGPRPDRRNGAGPTVPSRDADGAATMTMAARGAPDGGQADIDS